MTITISSGGVFAGQNISSGDPLIVLSSGVYELSLISSGGSATVSAGGSAGYLTVLEGGVLQGGGELLGPVEDFGTVSGLTLLSSSVGVGALTIFSGGTAHGLTLSAGVVQVESGGVIADTNILVGTEVIYSGGRASGDIVQGSGTLYDDGGNATGDTVLSGGTLALGGNLSGNLVVANASSTETVSGVTVLSGAVMGVIGGDAVSGATVSFGSGAGAIDLTVLKGGTAVGLGLLEGEAWIAGTVRQVVFEGVIATLSSGATASGATVSGGATVQENLGAIASATIVSSGGEIVEYGSARATEVESGGLVIVRSGGTASGTTVDGLGKQIVSSGGVALATTVLSGGVEEALVSGKTSGTVVSSGGREIVSSGGLAEQIDVMSSGVLTDLGIVRISGAGTLAGSISGGGEILKLGAGDLLLGGSEAGFSGSAVISGGTLELDASKSLGTGFAQFVTPATGSAVLQADAKAEPKQGQVWATTLSNFSGANEELDLRSIVFKSGATAFVDGSTLSLTIATRDYAFNIAGAAANSYVVTSDGQGGTLIETSTVVDQFVQAAAAFAPREAAKTDLVSSGVGTGQSPFLHATASAGAGHT
jgi:autotransporter passenger strand-loop-strand repeat protein/autotransporter-associated beta strand protein